MTVSNSHTHLLPSHGHEGHAINRILHHQLKDESLERTKTLLHRMKTRKESQGDVIHEASDDGSNEDEASSDKRSPEANRK